MKKILFTCLFLLCGTLFAQNYYEIPYVGTKSKLTKLSESEANSFLEKYGIKKELRIREKGDVGFSQIRPFEAIVDSVYREDIPDENNQTKISAYRVMYSFTDNKNQKTTCSINLDNEKNERLNIGQKIYFIKGENAEMYFEDVYYGNVIYRGTNSNGVTAHNIQFKIDSGFIYAFNITLAHYYHGFYMGLDNDRTEEFKFSEFEIYKDKISNVMNKSKIAFIPDLNFLPLIDKNNPFRYSLQNAFDGDYTTSYVPKAKTDIMNLDINFTDSYLYENEMITNVCIINGYAENLNLYKSNNRIREVQYGYYQENNKDDIPLCFQLKDNCLNKQFIQLEITKNSIPRYLWINILSIYNGLIYDDTCLAELNIKGNKSGWLLGEENE